MKKIYFSKYNMSDGALAEFNFGKRLLRNKGLVGQASRLGYKKAKQGMKFGKRLGNSGIKMGQNAFKKVKRYGVFGNRRRM